MLTVIGTFSSCYIALSIKAVFMHLHRNIVDEPSIDDVYVCELRG